MRKGASDSWFLAGDDLCRGGRLRDDGGGSRGKECTDNGESDTSSLKMSYALISPEMVLILNQSPMSLLDQGIPILRGSDKMNWLMHTHMKLKKGRTLPALFPTRRKQPTKANSKKESEAVSSHESIGVIQAGKTSHSTYTSAFLRSKNPNASSADSSPLLIASLSEAEPPHSETPSFLSSSRSRAASLSPTFSRSETPSFLSSSRSRAASLSPTFSRSETPSFLSSSRSRAASLSPTFSRNTLSRRNSDAKDLSQPSSPRRVPLLL
ncbi:hypothetical protein ZIOFF_055518 [Zingiber officinale]|uniref:Uncharacterized protein n=1 Tax=Zingiber officinale TaxID=94328 RepID=A0A8J5FMA1_ZINOF|nr:hypothetical protein ZIOFF_055518 [Zingiber officinale]